MHPFEFIYSCGFAAKKYYSLRRRKRLPSPVISIGNLTVGGTGKTPAVIALAEHAKGRGFKPVILTRGYHGKAHGPCFVTKGQQTLLSAEEAGDEPVLISEKLQGVPVVKGADRYESGMFAIRELGADPSLLFILDDGFQHFRIHRDKDVVLVDATSPFGNGRLLPMGRLREAPGSLGRADIVVLSKTSGEKEAEDLRLIIQSYTSSPVFLAGHEITGVRTASGRTYPPDFLRGKRLFAFCGIGSPESFMKTLVAAGACLSGQAKYRDHHAYSAGDLEIILSTARKCRAEWIVTTEKDIMKLRNLALPEKSLIIEVAFSAGNAFYDTVFKI